MILKMFSVYDVKANFYHGPYFGRTDVEVIRNFSYVAAMDVNSVFHKHGADYTLFATGEFDDSTGRVSTFESFVSHGTLLALGATYLGVDGRKTEV